MNDLILNQFYTHKGNNETYQILEFCKMKGLDDNWYDAVTYCNVQEPYQIYVRTCENFADRFIEMGGATEDIAESTSDLYETFPGDYFAEALPQENVGDCHGDFQ